MRLELEPTTTFPLTVVDNTNVSNTSWNFESLLKKGVAAAQSGDRDQARKLLSQATAINPSSEDAWMWLASISDYPEELLAFLNRVLEINPENEKAADWRTQTNSLLAKTFVQRALAARNEGSVEHVRQFLDAALAHDSESETAWYWKASVADSDDEKLELFARVLAINPDNIEAADAVQSIREGRVRDLLNAAEELLVNGNASEATAMIEHLVENENPETRERALLVMAAATGSDEEKVEFYSRVLEVNPSNSTAQEAVNSIERSRSDAAFADAKAAAATGDRAHALEVLEELVEQSPDFVDGWLLMSHLRSELDQKVEALERALEIDPENVAARSGLAFLALTFGTSNKSEDPGPAEPVFASAEEQLAVVADIDTTDEPNPALESEPVGSPMLNDPVEFAFGRTEETMNVEASEVSDKTEFALEATSAEAVEEFPAQPEFDEAPYHLESPRSVEDIFGPVNFEADPAGETVERLSPFADKVLEDSEFAEEVSSFERVDETSDNTDSIESGPSELGDAPGLAAVQNCPFCLAENDSQSFECSGCGATLTLSDIEKLLSGTSADRETLQHAVTEMEAQWNSREFTEAELTALGLGHMNLGNAENGFRYLQEASRLNPNNVILAGHVNTIAIRLDEKRRQSEAFEAMPKGKTILVVDDSPTVRKLISGKLEKSGHHVVCAVDGVDALAKMEEGMPDLVLLDITMPRMDGYEVCKQIRSNPENKNLPVVMISGKDGFFDKVRGRMAGTTGYVTKPFGPETLMKALETYLLPDEAE